jgi:adenylate kinase
MSVLLIGGTPGTGKTKVAQVLGSRLSVKVFNLGELADENGCISAKDKARNTGVIDEDCLVAAIAELVEYEKGRIILEGHYIDLVPFSAVETVIVLRTHPDCLKSRLVERGWPNNKTKENVEAEVIGVCQLDAIDSFGEEIVFEIDTTDLNHIQAADLIQELLNSPKDPERIDWMETLEKDGHLEDYLSD